MQYQEITSIKDPKIELCRDLSASIGRIKEKKVLLLGEEQISWALQHNLILDFVLMIKGYLLPKWLEQKVVCVASEGIMKKATETNYLIQIVAVSSMLSEENLLRKNDEFVVVLDHVVDAGNIGTIIRTANGFGINSFYALPTEFDPFQRKITDASRGLNLGSKITNFVDSGHLIQFLKKNDYQIVVSSPHAKGLQSQLKLDQRKVALVVGNETHGIGEELILAADHVIAVPMNPLVESLNVGVFTGISLYELKFKQVLAMLTEKILKNVGRKINVAAKLVQAAFDSEIKKVSKYSAKEIIFLMILNCDQKMSQFQASLDLSLKDEDLQRFLQKLRSDGLLDIDSEELWFLTENGKQLLANFWPIVESVEYKIFSQFSVADREFFDSMLDKIIKVSEEICGESV